VGVLERGAGRAGDGWDATPVGDDAHASLLAACAPARFAASLRSTASPSEAERGVEGAVA
jgi:hypothetical protein